MSNSSGRPSRTGLTGRSMNAKTSWPNTSHNLARYATSAPIQPAYRWLPIFQATDAAGKTEPSHMISGVNPQGCHVLSFKHTSTTELEHDRLWRTTQ